MLEAILAIVENEIHFPFIIALVIVASIGVLEIGLGIIGFGLGSMLDGLFEVDIDVDVDADINFGSAILSWLNIGKAPTLILVLIFLTFFGLSGITWQLFILESVWVAAGPAFVGGVLATRYLGRLLMKILPQETTMAVAQDSFRGCSGKILLGIASKDSFAKVAISDCYGKRHEVYVKPVKKDQVFNEGDEVVLIEKDPESSFIFLCVSKEDF